MVSAMAISRVSSIPYTNVKGLNVFVTPEFYVANMCLGLLSLGLNCALCYEPFF